tara:strand:- start:238 stop:921 length:684 start_codon:yes stop_codon:yes gene_type:complete
MGNLTDIKKKNVSTVAIEVLAKNLHMTYEQVAKEAGVSKGTISSWMGNPDFIEKVYTRYMELAGTELPAVVQAMIEEAKLGNVHAAKLILEHFGKLEQKLSIKVESNFEKFMSNVDSQEAEWFEVTNEETELLNVIAEHVGDPEIELPERHISNDSPKLRDDYERARLNGKVTTRTKEITEKSKQAERYVIRKRAKAVGLELLGSGRHTKSERDAWMKKLIKLEQKK